MFDSLLPRKRRSVRHGPRLAPVLLAVAVALASVAAPARAATDASDVVVEVVDAASGAPIGLARVVLQGEAAAIGYTDAEGRARFESVATGSYRAAVTKRGFLTARSALFDVGTNRTSNVRVRLAKSGALRQIGSVSVTSSPARASREVGQDDALRFLDGSLRNLGYVVEHAVRGRTSPFTGLTFTDETGLTYRHDGDRTVSGDLAKLRWAPSIAQTLTFTATATDSQNAIVCAQQTALFPCGYGPDAFGHSRGTLMTLNENATIGATTLSVAGFVNGSRNATDEPARLLAGTATPQRTDFRSLARGFSLGWQLPGGERHDVSFSATSYGVTFDGSTTTTLGTFPLTQTATFHGASIVDRWHPNQRVTVTGRAGVNGGDGSSALATSLGVRWQPNRAVAYDLAASSGDSGAGLVISGTAFPDPRSLTFDCAHGLAYGNLPSANAPHQRSSALRRPDR